MANSPRFGVRRLSGTDADNVPADLNNVIDIFDANAALFGHGLIASRPVSTLGSPGIVDRLYWATDVSPDNTSRLGVLYRDNGTGWDAMTVGPLGRMATGTFTPPAVTGNFDVTGLGFMPKMLKFTVQWTTQSDTAFTLSEGVAISPSNRWATMLRGSSGEWRRRWYTNRCLVQIDSAPSIVISADFVQFLTDGFRLNFTVAPGVPSDHVIAWEAYS